MVEDDIVFETILHNFKQLMRTKPIINKNAWLLIRPWSSLGIKYKFEPLQANLKVSISRLRAGIMPSRGRIRSPCATMGCGWPDD
jgi:hypothetical protein